MWLPAVVAAACAAGRLVPVDVADQRLEAAAEGAGILGFAGVMVVLCAAYVPTPVLAALAGAALGPIGGVIALLAFVVAGVAEFLAVRLLLGARAKRRLVLRLGWRARAFVNDGGWRAVLALRLTPGVPFAMTSCALGATQIGTAGMAAGTALGAAPRTALYAAVGSSLGALDGARLFATAAGLACVGLAGLLLSARLWALSAQPQDPPATL
jgi:uncharacterized membrane protein YdjX (TVP38/TMEM64 family)